MLTRDGAYITSVELRALYSDQYYVASCSNFQLVFVAFFLQKESQRILVIILILVFNWNHETHFLEGARPRNR